MSGSKPVFEIKDGIITINVPGIPDNEIVALDLA